MEKQFIVTGAKEVVLVHSIGGFGSCPIAGTLIDGLAYGLFFFVI
jgi:triacylglycerol esterase/lipase EstA (alpha/beta hydrolase family)